MVKSELLPTKRIKHPEGLHRIVIDDFIFDRLAEIRKRERLYDRLSVIYWLLKKCGEIEEE